jgi:geranylgeranyl diphosphate synthase type II
MNPNNDLKHLRRLIDTKLASILPKDSPIAEPMLEAMRYSVLGGGKRIRPLLTCTICSALDGRFEDALLPGCAIELIHAYSLIHDDLPAMDDDDLRHGRPSTHKQFGEAIAILAGDSLHSLAFQSIVKAPFISEKVKIKAIAALAEAAGWRGMSGGQCLDINSEGKRLSIEQLRSLHTAKTGALICTSFQIGALCAGVDDNSEQYRIVTQVGEDIGLAFQIVDDILDVTSDSETLGKPSQSDKVAEKNTFPQLMGIEKSQEEANELLATSLQLLCDSGIENPALSSLLKQTVLRKN